MVYDTISFVLLVLSISIRVWRDSVWHNQWDIISLSPSPSMHGWSVINSAWEKTLCSDSEHFGWLRRIASSKSLSVSVCVCVWEYPCVRVCACHGMHLNSAFTCCLCCLWLRLCLSQLLGWSMCSFLHCSCSFCLSLSCSHTRLSECCLFSCCSSCYYFIWASRCFKVHFKCATIVSIFRRLGIRQISRPASRPRGPKRGRAKRGRGEESY